jgi:hypothetical protein
LIRRVMSAPAPSRSAPAEVVQVDQPVRGRREQQRRVEPRRQLVERLERPPRQWHLTARAARLAVLYHLAGRDRPPHVQDPLAAVHVATLGRLPLLGAQPVAAANAGSAR